jgi:LuxR family transcriptional regulator, maltose regulon positive regulatory protein
MTTPAPTRATVVERRRLVDLLVRRGSHKLTLIDAPAGWGKTTLLAEWRDDPGEARPFAWVSLDRTDNDPVRFWTYVVTALQMVELGLGERALAALGRRGPDTSREVLAALINELAAGAPELVLALDDYHMIANDEIHAGVELLLERLPSQLHLAIATRSDPPLPLARMRVRGELLEVRSDALAFRDEEATALLNAHLRLGLSETDVARLQQRTEGWAAALYLAALSLRGRVDAAEFIGAFAGDNRHVVDYLGAEVLAAIRRQQGDLEAARGLVAESRDALDGSADPGMLAGLVAAGERSVAAAGGRGPTGRRRRAQGSPTGSWQCSGSCRPG